MEVAVWAPAWAITERVRRSTTLKEPYSAGSRAPALLIPFRSTVTSISPSTRETSIKWRIMNMVSTLRPGSGTRTPDDQGKTMRGIAVRSTSCTTGRAGRYGAGAPLRVISVACTQALPAATACRYAEWGNSLAGDAMQEPCDDSNDNERPTRASGRMVRSAAAPIGAMCITGAAPTVGWRPPTRPAGWEPARGAPRHHW